MLVRFLFGLSLLAPLYGQDAATRVETASQSVALVLGREGKGGSGDVVGSAFVVRPNGILLTALHVVKSATALQIRLKSGEVFDDVQLLGIDERRDVAALKISGSGLPALELASAADAKPGDAVTLISHAAALPWSVSTGVISAYRMANEIPGAGEGYRLIQFTAATSPGSSGGLLVDSKNRAFGIVTGSLTGGQNMNFAVPVESVAGLADAAPQRRFANGADLKPPVPPSASKVATSSEEAASVSKDAGEVLKNFKTLFIQTRTMNFDPAQVKSAIAKTKGFPQLAVTIVDDIKAADVVLDISFTFPFDYPFELRHRQSTTMLLAGKGSGPFSAPAGAASVARETVKLLTPHRKKSTPAQK